MMTKRFRDERGPTNAGWLKSMHTFSFGHYMDPDHMGFGPLRVINEDWVIPGAGFPTHPHDNMEIITYVLKGALAHKDSMGSGSTIKPGDIQLMSAGSGVTHSEFNASSTEDVHLLQIWIMPDVRNTAPDYQEKRLDVNAVKNRFATIVSPDGAEGSLTIRQNAKLLVGHFEDGMETKLDLDPARAYWVQIASGMVGVDGDTAYAGDAYALTGEAVLSLKSKSDSEILLFDLPVW